MIGQVLGHYRILDKIGSGGMGEVYRARDERLKRNVAIKILSSQWSVGTEMKHLLLREAQSASSLNDPHICTIYEVGEVEGRDFIVMELVEGHPLATLIPPEGLSVSLVLRYGTQIAAALRHAHDHALVHRDIKPSNIVVTPAGQVKILDFGLAKLTRENEAKEETISLASVMPSASIVGTLPYMAPQTLRGEIADARGDIWALGVVLYEMAAGGRPFRGQTDYEVSSAILRETPTPLPTGVPAGLRHVIDRCLEKESGQRYQHAGEVLAALEAAGSDRSPAIGSSAHRTTVPGRRVGWIVAALVVALIAASVALSLDGVRTALFGRRPAAQIQSLAVLPLENLSGDPEQDYFANGMTDALITDLAKGGKLRVISRTSVMPYKGAHKPLPRIAQELGVDAIVEGSVLESGNRVRITAQLIEARSDKHLWAERYERDLRDILALQDDVASAIAIAIKGNLAQDHTLPRRQVDPDAYRLYLKGMYHWDKRTAEGFQKATEYFHQAIEKDPTFALAYSALAGSYLNLSGYSLTSTRKVLPKARAAALKALELDNTLADAHEVLATVKMMEWQFADAEKEFRQALALDSNNAGTHQGYGTYLARMGRFDESSAELGKAVELEPVWLMHGVQLGNTYYYQGRYDKAIDEYNKVLEMNPDFWLAHGYRAFA
jgi:serine/threonine-protein kinase